MLVVRRRFLGGTFETVKPSGRLVSAFDDHVIGSDEFVMELIGVPAGLDEIFIGSGDFRAGFNAFFINSDGFLASSNDLPIDFNEILIGCVQNLIPAGEIFMTGDQELPAPDEQRAT